jgi:zinc transporter ZupT
VIHSTMEGLGIGAADSYISQISVVFAILIHKIFESIALAGLLMDGKVSLLQSRIMFTVFALATPTGALCTALLQSYIEANAVAAAAAAAEGSNEAVEDLTGKVLDGVVTALAAGSFM